MNYLAHFHLADRIGSSLTGNYLGDAVKGASLDDWPEAIARGIRLHRGIDAYTDTHSEVRRALGLIESPRRRFAGIIVDVAFDHFLALDWQRFHDLPLSAFAERVYRELARDADLMPDVARRRFEAMRRHDWLVGYRRPEVIERAIDAIAARLSRPTPLYGGAEAVWQQREALEDCFNRFYPQLLGWVRERQERPD